MAEKLIYQKIYTRKDRKMYEDNHYWDYQIYDINTREMLGHITLKKPLSRKRQWILRRIGLWSYCGRESAGSKLIDEVISSCSWWKMELERKKQNPHLYKVSP